MKYGFKANNVDRIIQVEDFFFFLFNHLLSCITSFLFSVASWVFFSCSYGVDVMLMVSL